MPGRLFVALLALTLGCHKDAAGPTVSERFTLVRLNGLPLPYVRLHTGTMKEEVLGGRITLYANGTYADLTTFRTTQGTVVSVYDNTLEGPYTLDGSTYTFTVISEDDPSGDDRYSGVMVGDTLVVQVGTTVWKYVER